MSEVSARNFIINYEGSRIVSVGPVCTDCRRALEELEDCMQRPRIVYLECRSCDRLWWARKEMREPA